ncbi:MAG: hypothetical protein V4702_04125 [Patescibacteria group bacterium]
MAKKTKTLNTKRIDQLIAIARQISSFVTLVLLALAIPVFLASRFTAANTTFSYTQSDAVFYALVLTMAVITLGLWKLTAIKQIKLSRTDKLNFVLLILSALLFSLALFNSFINLLGVNPTVEATKLGVLILSTAQLAVLYVACRYFWGSSYISDAKVRS